jgi:hypothetical protein
VRQNGKPGVFVIEEGRAKFRAVKVGVRSETGVEVLDGVTENDTVVTQRARPLVDGDKLRISGERK